MIRKVGGKFVLYSLKKNPRQIQFFKSRGQ